MNEQAPQATVEAVAGSRAKVFVSYSRKDLLFAQSLVEALTEAASMPFSTRPASRRENPGRNASAG
jgi:hypothetical protein